MINKIRAELEPFAEVFQLAGADGLRRVAQSPLDGDQWHTKRLQRDPFLHGLRRTLPTEIGSFTFDSSLYERNRLVYRSQVHEAELVFRRRGSLRAFRNNQRPSELGLFDAPERVYPPHPAVSFRQIACIWDLPQLDADHQAIGVFPFMIKLAKENTLLGQGEWEGGFRLLPEAGIMPASAEFDMDAPDWEVDAEEEGEAQ